MEYDPGSVPTDQYQLIQFMDNELQKLKFAINEIYQPESWHEIGGTNEPAFQNSWVNVGGANDETAAFRMYHDKRVAIKGYIDSGTITDGTVIFTFPADYRPSKTIRIAGMYIQGSAENAYQLEIQTDGDVAIYGVSGASPVLSLHAIIEIDN